MALGLFRRRPPEPIAPAPAAAPVPPPPAAASTHPEDESAKAILELLELELGAMIRQLESRIRGLDYVFKPLAQKVASARVTEKKRSVKLHYGTIGFRKGQPIVTVTDAALLIETAKTTPGMEKCWRQQPPPPPEVVKKELNTYIKATGDVPKGCVVEPAKDSFYVE